MQDVQRHNFMMNLSCHLRARHGVQGQRMSASHGIRWLVNLAGLTIHTTETFNARNDVFRLEARRSLSLCGGGERVPLPGEDFC